MTNRYSASFFREGEDAGEEVVHAQDQRGVAAQMGRGDEQRPDRVSCGIARPTVRENLPASVRGIPDWAEVHRQLKRKGGTLFLLGQEYRASCPDGYQYSWFCGQYRAWRGKLDVVMRQDHRAGEKLFRGLCGSDRRGHRPGDG